MWIESLGTMGEVLAGPPAFQFYASDWAHSVSSMTLEERGAYITLLAWSWEHGPVPDNNKRLSAILGCSKSKTIKLWSEISRRWIQDEGGEWVNPRLESVRSSASKYHTTKIEIAKAGGYVRWKSDQARIHGRTRSERLSNARAKGTHTDEEWLEMLNAYGFSCLACGCKPIGRPCKDHIVPIYKGGSDSIQNIQPMCRECNSSKGPNSRDFRVGHPNTLDKWLPKAGVSEGVMQAFDAQSTPASPISDLHLRSSDQEQEPKIKTICSAPLNGAEPAILEFPTVGNGPKTWELTKSQAAGWSHDFPDVDVLAEAKKARAWILASPERRKTARGMRRFLVGWLSRSNDKRRSYSHQGRENATAHALRAAREFKEAIELAEQTFAPALPAKDES